MAKQKFHHGDHVRVASDLGPTMSHFVSDTEAIVIGSYRDQFGGSNTNIYTLHLKGRGECSWYYENQLSLIASGRCDLLAAWVAAEDAEAREKADLDWIFHHGAEVLKCPSGSSLQALADTLGIVDLWGARGEGVDYYTNSMAVLAVASPFLEAGDQAGWMAFAAAYKDRPLKANGEQDS